MTDDATGRPAGDTAGHAELMDRTYRFQRHIYDATRAYFLLGRDRMIAELDPPSGGSVLEVACGTGRNLALIGRRHPDARLHGIDISEEMLRSARATLGARAVLARGDACSFRAGEHFDVPAFDRVVLSYGLSMIPDWRAALASAVAHLAPGGRLHVVDFGGQERLPGWFRSGLRAWLARFHVEPRAGLAAAAEAIARDAGCTAEIRPLYRDYARSAVISRP